MVGKYGHPVVMGHLNPLNLYYRHDYQVPIFDRRPNQEGESVDRKTIKSSLVMILSSMKSGLGSQRNMAAIACRVDLRFQK